MSDDYSQNSNYSFFKKKFFTLILNQLFHGEPKNRRDLLTLIKDSKQNELIDHDTCGMLEGVMDISEQRVRDIMIPRPHIVYLKKNQSFEESLNIIINSVHSRFPVISENKNHIEGILMAKDLLPFFFRKSENFSVSKILRPVIIVPESKRVDKMLKDFRSQRDHIAIVIDEFGSVSGLITIKDILELIVGEIYDEYNYKDNKNIRQLNRNTFAIRALTNIKEFNEKFHSEFSDEDIDTVGGLVMQAFGHLPTRGEKININRYIFKITMSNNRKIIQMHVTIPQKLMKIITKT